MPDSAGARLPRLRLARRLVRKALSALGAGFQTQLALDVLRNMGQPSAADAWTVIEDLLARASTEGRQELCERIAGWWRDDPRSLDYAQRQLVGLRTLVERRGGFAGARILELGPGYSLVPGLLALAAGAQRYVALDRYSELTRWGPFYAGLRARGDADGVCARYLDPERPLGLRLDGALGYVAPADAARLPFADASFDVVFSTAVLEHVEQPARAAAETARVLAPGGVAQHVIDYRDHRDFDQPRAFLRLSDAEWTRLLAAERGFDFTNRWRHHQFVEAFAAAGLTAEQVTCTRRPIDEAERQQLAAPFRELPLDELAIVGGHFLLRKAGA